MAPPAMAPPAMYSPAMAPPAMAPPAMAPPMATPPPMMTDSVMMTNTAMASATASAYLSGATMAYGSGSSSWSSQSYQNCVQQCVASFGGAPPSMSTAAASGGSGSSGSGVTHTVIVAPTQGVLRFVPFATEANPGDVVEFQWHANNHTVTKSSQLTPCNKTSDAPFATGEQNMPFTFQQVVNDTSPTFFYCGTVGHCEKGMFGIINPPSVQNNANTSVASMMPAMVTNYSSVSAMNTQMMNLTAGNSYAANWGSNIDMSQMPSWSQQFIAENVMYTRSVLGMNPNAVQNGLINVGASPLMVPQDLAAAAPAASSASAAASKTGAASTPASSAGGALSPASSTNGAGRAVVSGGLGVVALAALFLAL
ncbi:hypothetical protein B0H21DRAFT_718624 [Amylocystis lapponica]|nr:hypothetical protein B0H21DRAFT_718624 [Amylocystis lapponica]